MAHVVIFGAGRVGRGFLAEIFQQAGCAITFVDTNINLVDEINRARAYTIHKAVGALTDSVRIHDVSALHVGQEGAIVDLLAAPGAYAAIAVSPFSLREVADLLAVAIARRTLETPEEPLDVLMCDNNADPVARVYALLGNLLGGAALEYLDRKVGFVRTIVMRMSSEQPPPGDEPLALLNDGYPEMPVDAEAFRGAIPASPMLRLTNDFTAESVRKVYTLNMAQAAMAYLGAPLGLSRGIEAIRHPRVRPYLVQALEESAHGLCGEYGFARMQMKEWNGSVLASLENPVLGESLFRLGIDAGRKLGRSERLVGAAMLCQKYDRPPHALARAIAYGFLYDSDDPGTRRMRECVEEEGIEFAIERYSAIDFKNPLRLIVLEEYERAKAFIAENPL